jgi:signal transduction histidine kinase
MQAVLVESSSKSVLVLLLGQPGTPYAVDYLQGMRKAFNSNKNITINLYSEFLNLQQFPTTEDEIQLIQWLSTKYSKLKFDAIIPVGRDSLEFTEKWRDQLWPKRAVIFSIVDETGRKEFPAGFTGTNFMQDYVGTVQVALQLQPETQHLALVSGASKADRFNHAYTLNQLKSLTKKLDIIEIPGLSLAETIIRLSTLPKNTIVLVASFFVDGDGQLCLLPEYIPKFTAASNCPIYELTRHAFGLGTVGGILNDYEEAGTETAQLVIRVLNGESASSIPIQQTRTAHLMLDWRQLDRWGIDESRVPSGSIVMFKTPTFWEQYKWQISGAIALIILQTLLIVALLTERSMRRRAQESERKTTRELAHVSRATLMGELASSLAHELNQPLTAILVNAEAASDLVISEPSNVEEVKEVLSEIISDDIRAGEIIHRIRALLKKEEIDFAAINLNDIVNDVVRMTQHEALIRKVDVETEVEDGLPVLLGDYVQLQQLILNLVMNALDASSQQQSRRRFVEIFTKSHDSEVQLLVRDSGKGIQQDQLPQIFEPFFTTKKEGLGMGLSICRSIVKEHGGHIWAESKYGNGASFYCSFPTAKSKLLRTS